METDGIKKFISKIPFFKKFTDSIIFFSVAWSNELVASSSIKISGSLYSALAIPILCCWPPEILIPFSPTTVSAPSLRLFKNTFKLAFSIAFFIKSSLIFSSLAIPLAYQHRVLSVGILSAILLRVPLLLVGATLLERFQFMIYIFGALLIYAALKILLRKEEKKIKIEKNLGVKLLGRLIPFSPELKKEQFFVKKNAIRHATPMLVALVVVEMSDLMFAIDSIPAVLAISSDPFILITSNVFALLGLRSLYFLLAGLMEKFYYFRHTLIILLFFIGAKMILSEFFHIRVEIALALIITILSVSVLLSYIRQHRINLEKNP